MFEEHHDSEGIGARLTGAADIIAAVVDAFEPERFSGHDAAALTEIFARIEHLGAAGTALAARRVAQTGTWRESGARNAADWLGRQTATTASQAAIALSTSQALVDQPDLDHAVRAGELSTHQAAEIAAAVKDAPGQAAELVERAKSDTLQGLRDACQQARSASTEEDESARHRRIHARRYLRSWIDEQGAGRLEGRMTAAALATLRSQLAPFEDTEFQAARRQGRREPRDAYVLDTLLAAVDAALRSSGTGEARPKAAPRATGPGDNSSALSPDAGRPGATAGTSTAPGEPVTPPEPSLATPEAAGVNPSAPEPQTCGLSTADASTPSLASPARVIVLIDHAALIRGRREPGECCEIQGVGLVPVETVRSMMEDAFLAAVVTDGCDVRTVAHLGRSVTAAQRTALYVRDRECVVPGCHVTTRLEIDHIEEWAATHITRLDALARLCHYHHHLKTYEGWRLHGPPGRWVFAPPSPGTR